MLDHILFLTILIHLRIPSKLVLFWQVRQEVSPQQQRVLKLRTAALGIVFFFTGMVALVPTFTPKSISYALGYWLQGIGIVGTIIASIVLLFIYVRR